MTTMNQILKGLEIIKRHHSEEEMDSHNFCAEHDQIWCGEFIAGIMSKDELDEMEKLGWFEDEDSWSIFT